MLIVGKVENTERYKENALKCTITYLGIPLLFDLRFLLVSPWSWPLGLYFLGCRRYTLLQKVQFIYLIWGKNAVPKTCPGWQNKIHKSPSFLIHDRTSFSVCVLYLCIYVYTHARKRTIYIFIPVSSWFHLLMAEMQLRFKLLFGKT